MKQSADVDLLSKEVSPMMSKAIEFLVTEITAKAFKIMNLEGRTKIRSKDILNAV